LETAGNIAKSSKIEPQALVLDVQPVMIIGFKLYRKKYFLFQIERYF